MCKPKATSPSVVVRSLSEAIAHLTQIGAQPSHALLESALSQLRSGIADTSVLQPSIAGSDEFAAFKRWGYGLVSQAMSPGQIMEALGRLTLLALTAGWMAYESSIQSSLLTTLLGKVSPSASDGDTPGDSRRGRKAEE